MALAAFAQEMDTTYVLNEKGETIGIIHEKGTNPFVAAPAPAEDPAVAAPAPTEVAPVSESPAPAKKRSVYASGPAEKSAAPETVALQGPVFEDDSTRYYQGLVDHYITSGNKLRRVGNGMMLGGGIGLGAGLMLMVAGLNETHEDYYGDDEMTGTGAAMFLTGYVMVLASPEVFATGLVLKIVGGSRLRKGQRYEDKLTSYRLRNAYSFSAVPTFNPVNGAMGGAFALNF